MGVDLQVKNISARFSFPGYEILGYIFSKKLNDDLWCSGHTKSGNYYVALLYPNIA